MPQCPWPPAAPAHDDIQDFDSLPVTVDVAPPDIAGPPPPEPWPPARGVAGVRGGGVADGRPSQGLCRGLEGRDVVVGVWEPKRRVLGTGGGGGDSAGPGTPTTPAPPPPGAFGQQLVAKGVALRRPWAPKAPDAT